MKQGDRPYTDCVAGGPDMSFAIRLPADLSSVRWAERSTRSLASAASAGRRQIRAIAAAQNVLIARFVAALKRCDEREPLIGVRFSDSSRDLFVAPAEPGCAKPANPRGFVRVKANGVLDQD